jgi:DNA mismatch repair protein MSH3
LKEGSHYFSFLDELESAGDDKGKAFAAPLLCISEELRGGMGADERVLFGMVAVTPSTGDVIHDEFLDSHMRSELEVTGTFP